MNASATERATPLPAVIAVRCVLCLAECSPADVASTGACLPCHEDGSDRHLRRPKSGEYPAIEIED